MSKKFKHLLVPESYRHYWSKYPEGYTILEALLNWVDSVNQLTDNINDWNIYLDDFVKQFDDELTSTVRELLNEMEQEGILAEIINEEIFSELNDKVDTKATQEDLEIERARISNLTANAGDTDGNAELLDIRVGFDGVTYQTAGDATRALSNYMKSENESWVV